MKFDLRFDGLDDMMKRLKDAADPVSREIAETAALQQIGERTKKAMRNHIPASRNNAKSGRSLKYGASSRPKHGHARDNIPVTKVYRRSDGSLNIDIGWLLSDNSEYFYMKFVEWGTSKMPPRDFLYTTFAECEPELKEIAIEEYEKLLERLGV